MQIYIYMCIHFGGRSSFHFALNKCIMFHIRLNCPIPSTSEKPVAEPMATQCHPMPPSSLKHMVATVIHIDQKPFLKKSVMLSLPSNLKKKCWYRSASSDLSGCLVLFTLQVSRRPAVAELDLLKPIHVATHLQSDPKVHKVKGKYLVTPTTTYFR